MPFYETENSVREVLSKNDKTSIDILKQVGDSLIIVDALRGYLDHGNVESIWKNIKVIVQNAEEVGKKKFLFWVTRVHFPISNKYKVFWITNPFYP